MPSFYDLGTIRIYESGGVLEMFFPRKDSIAHQAAKALKGRFDPNRKSWKIDPQYSRLPAHEMVERITEAVLAGADEKWRASFVRMTNLVTTTRDYGIYAGAGGLRIELPRGHRHEYTLRDDIPGASRDGSAWLIPSESCITPRVSTLIVDIIKGDKLLWAKSVDHMAGYNMTGPLNIIEGERESLGLVVGDIVFAEQAFVRKADKGIPSEPIKLYPLRLLSLDDGEDEHGAHCLMAKLAFVTGEESHRIACRRLLPATENKPLLDVHHVGEGKWSRRRR